MKTRKFLVCHLTLLLTAAGILIASGVNAQERIEFPQIPQLRGMGMGVIMDGTMFSSGSSTRIQTSMENGVKKIRAVDNDIKTYIEEDPSNGILVKITKQYGPEDMDELMEQHPALYMSVKDFPAETEDAESVEVSIGVTKTYEASSVDELKEKHPVAYEAYEKYANGNDSLQIFRGRIGRQLLMPELRIIPELRRIDPSDVRIHDDDDTKKKDSQKEDKDT